MSEQSRSIDKETIQTYMCPVCGYDELSRAPYYPDDWGSPSDEICPSCGTQFGYTDAAGARYDTTKRATAREVDRWWNALVE